MLNGVAWFFDLYAQNRPEHDRGFAGDDNELALWRQLLVYLFCVIGILAGPYALAAATGTYATFAEMFGSGIRLFWAVLFGFVLTAFLFKTLLSAKTPLFLQIGASIVSGFASGKILPKAIAALTSWVTGAGAS